MKARICILLVLGIYLAVCGCSSNKKTIQYPADWPDYLKLPKSSTPAKMTTWNHSGLEFYSDKTPNWYEAGIGFEFRGSRDELLKHFSSIFEKHHGGVTVDDYDNVVNYLVGGPHITFSIVAATDSDGSKIANRYQVLLDIPADSFSEFGIILN
ncbi:MAG: hypothetical protein H7A35_04540 [Planctomycetales bacterium]|nr:hypothetical protein [bacterium]UNM09326.1 MAG: hypothetical protein H7A35_04540 [Planctomycetales bacterium]